MTQAWAGFALGLIAGFTLGVLFMALWTVAVYKDEDDTVRCAHGGKDAGERVG